MKIYHGTFKKEFNLHEGVCFTESRDVAETYATYQFGANLLVEAEIDTEGLKIVEINGGYDHDENIAIGDDGKTIDDADVLIFTDEGIDGYEHTTVRLMTEKAIEQTKIIGTEIVEG